MKYEVVLYNGNHFICLQDDTISINHNWVNGCNVGKMWSSLRQNLAKVKLEISDCEGMDGWHEHCQIMLNAVYGLDYEKFCEFLLHIMFLRMSYLSEHKNMHVYGSWVLGESHLKFDLIQAKQILLQLITDNDFIKLNYFLKSHQSISSVLQDAEYCLCDQWNLFKKIEL